MSKPPSYNGDFELERNPETGEYQFQQRSDYRDTATVGKIDEDRGILHGVKVIELGDARGHGLVVDETMLSQVHQEIIRMGQVGVWLNHKAGAEMLFGDLQNPWHDGDCIRADLHMNPEHKEYKAQLDNAKKRSKVYGLSVAFQGKPELITRGGKTHFAARCEELRSADIVSRPAVNKTLFSEKVGPPVDTTSGGMTTDEKLDLLLDKYTALEEKVETGFSAQEEPEFQFGQVSFEDDGEYAFGEDEKWHKGRLRVDPETKGGIFRTFDAHEDISYPEGAFDDGSDDYDDYDDEEDEIEDEAEAHHDDGRREYSPEEFAEAVGNAVDARLAQHIEFAQADQHEQVTEETLFKAEEAVEALETALSAEQGKVAKLTEALAFANGGQLPDVFVTDEGVAFDFEQAPGADFEVHEFVQVVDQAFEEREDQAATRNDILFEVADEYPELYNDWQIHKGALVAA